MPSDYDHGCDYGKSLAKQLRAVWATLTALGALVAVQILLTFGALAQAQSVARQSNSQDTGLAVLEERLRSIDTRLESIEGKLP